MRLFGAPADEAGVAIPSSSFLICITSTLLDLKRVEGFIKDLQVIFREGSRSMGEANRPSLQEMGNLN